MSGKIITIKLSAVAVIVFFLVTAAFYRRSPVQSIIARETKDLTVKKWTDELIQPIPTELSLDAEKVALGEKLFNDAQLSHDNTVSCAACHNLNLGGNRPVRSFQRR